MVLVINGVRQNDVPPNSRALYAAHPFYRESAAQLTMSATKLVGPAGLLYIQQREMGATVPQDSEFLRKNNIIVMNVAYKIE